MVPLRCPKRQAEIPVVHCRLHIESDAQEHYNGLGTAHRSTAACLSRHHSPWRHAHRSVPKCVQSQLRYCMPWHLQQASQPLASCSQVCPVCVLSKLHLALHSVKAFQLQHSSRHDIPLMWCTCGCLCMHLCGLYPGSLLLFNIQLRHTIVSQSGSQ